VDGALNLWAWSRVLYGVTTMPLASDLPPPSTPLPAPDGAASDGPGSDGSASETAPVVPVGAVGRRSADDEFAAFMAEHTAALLRTAWYLVGDAHQAEDLVQQALVRTYAAWGRASSGDPLAYTRRILVNLRVDSWRRRRREVLLAPAEMPDASHDPSGATLDRDQLVRALALLTPRQRRIVVLRHLVGLPEAEVAAELGVSLGTVKSTASRGLATLRTTLTSGSGS
jgi:RNA polymerase sigma-70 factor (sigma-E family)